MLIEACVESVESAIAAEQGGAERVELCAALLEGGLTPSAGAIAQARRRLSIALHVIIRPRGGDFLYSDIEHQVMLADIDRAKETGADGVVIGALTADGDIDTGRTAELIDRARPLSVTFHRAFDMARDPLASLDRLIELGVDRLLTSGQEESALAGLDLIGQLVTRAAGRIIIMPGAGIHEGNIAKIARLSGADELHVTGFAEVASAMRYRNPRCFMGGTLRPPEYQRTVTDRHRMAELVARARVAGNQAADHRGDA